VSAGRPPQARAVRLAVAALVLGLGCALVAQLALAGWAEQSELHHQVQHGLIFAGGLVAGAAVAALYRLGRRP